MNPKNSCPKNSRRTLQVLAGVAAAWTLVLAGCDGSSDGGPNPIATSTPTSNATPGTTPSVTPGTTPTTGATPGTTATPGATSTAIPGPTLLPTPTGAPSATVPLQFRGFYSGAASNAIPQITFRINAQRQVIGTVTALNNGGVGQTLPLRGTLSIAPTDINNADAVAFLDLSASGVFGGQPVTYRFTGTIQRGGTQSIISGSGTAITQFSEQARSETVQVTRVSN